MAGRRSWILSTAPGREMSTRPSWSKEPPSRRLKVFARLKVSPAGKRSSALNPFFILITFCFPVVLV